jgi:hypothetical protein
MEILNEVVPPCARRSPVPLEALADRAVRTLGYDKTVLCLGRIGSFVIFGKASGTSASTTSLPVAYDASRAVPQQPERAGSSHAVLSHSRQSAEVAGSAIASAAWW